MGLKMGFSDTDIMLELEEGYCINCGKLSRPILIRRASEDYDPPGSQGRIVFGYVSECCGDELSPTPLNTSCSC